MADASDFTTENTSQTFASLPQPPVAPPALPIASIVVGLATGVTGMCANAVVFVVLVYARRQFGSHVNTLIANQSAMDLFACIFSCVALGMSVPGSPRSYLPTLGELGNNVVCFLFRNRVLSIVCTNAEKIGLVVTAVRRSLV